MRSLNLASDYEVLSLLSYYPTGWSSGNGLDVYLEVFLRDTGYRERDSPTFPQSLHANPGIVPRLCQAASFQILSSSSILSYNAIHV
jgi:hypothetical protein